MSFIQMIRLDWWQQEWRGDIGAPDVLTTDALIQLTNDAGIELTTDSP